MTHIEKYLKRVFTILLSIAFVFCSFSGCSADVKYISYSAPIFPLTGIDGFDGIQVSRSITLDFWLYEKLKLDHMYDSYTADVIDEYTLHNTDSEKHTITLAYPFTGNLITNPKMIPKVKINDEPVTSEILTSHDPQCLIQNAYSFASVQKALSSEDFLTEALSKPEQINTPVTVYCFYDIAYSESAPGSDVFLHVEYEANENTTLWASDYDYTSDTGLCINAEKRELRIYVVGEPLRNLRAGGIVGYEVNEKATTDSVTYALETYEDTLENCLANEASQYSLSDDYIFTDLVTPSHLLSGAFKELLQGEYSELEKVNNIGDLFYQVATQRKIMYVLIQVELEANAECTIQISFSKEPCVGSVRQTNGYEVATSLNSTLEFTDQTVSVVNYTGVDLSKTNTSINLENNISSASLDINTDRYFINVFH